MFNLTIRRRAFRRKVLDNNVISRCVIYWSMSVDHEKGGVFASNNNELGVRGGGWGGSV